MQLVRVTTTSTSVMMHLEGIHRHLSLLDINTTSAEPNTTLLNHLNHNMFRVLAPAVAFLLLLLLLGVAGNILVCFIFFQRMKRNFQNSLLLWLGVFDLMSISIGVPSELYDLRHYYLYPSAEACRSLRFLTTFASLSSILVLVVIAIDRYRKVCHPLHHQFHQSNIPLVVVIMLIISSLFSVPAIFVYGHRTFPTKIPEVYGHDCSVSDTYKDGIFPLLYEAILAGAFGLILLLLIFIYIRIWLEIRRHRRYLMSHSMGAMPSSELSSSDMRQSSFNNRKESQRTVISRLSSFFAITGRSRQSRKVIQENQFNGKGSLVTGERQELNPRPDMIKEESEEKMGEKRILDHEEGIAGDEEDMVTLDSLSSKGVTFLQDYDPPVKVEEGAAESSHGESHPSGHCYSHERLEIENNVSDGDDLSDHDMIQINHDQTGYHESRFGGLKQNNELEMNTQQTNELQNVSGEFETAFGTEPPEGNTDLIKIDQSERPMLKSSQSVQSVTSTRAKKVRKAYNYSTRRTTVITSVITVGFILSYLPNLTLVILRSVYKDFEHNLDDASLIVYNIFLRSYFANNVINVFVYASMNEVFRNQLRIFCCNRSKDS